MSPTLSCCSVIPTAVLYLELSTRRNHRIIISCPAVSSKSLYGMLRPSAHPALTGTNPLAMLPFLSARIVSAGLVHVSEDITASVCLLLPDPSIDVSSFNMTCFHGSLSELSIAPDHSNRILGGRKSLPPTAPSKVRILSSSPTHSSTSTLFTRTTQIRPLRWNTSSSTTQSRVV